MAEAEGSENLGRTGPQPQGRAGGTKKGYNHNRLQPDVAATGGQLTPAVISFPAKEQWLKNKCSPPLFPPPGPKARGLPQAERMESLSAGGPASFRPALWSPGPGEGLPRLSSHPLRSRLDSLAGTFSLPLQALHPVSSLESHRGMRTLQPSGTTFLLSRPGAHSAQEPGRA